MQVADAGRAARRRRSPPPPPPPGPAGAAPPRRSAPASRACLSSAASSSSTPRPRDATVDTIGGRHAPGSECRPPSASIALRSRTVCVGAVPVGLVHHEHVGDLEDARLGGLDPVAHARREQHQRGVGRRGDLAPRPGPPRRSRPAPRRSRPRPAPARPAGVAAASPPRCPRRAIDRMNTPASVAWSCIRTRSPSSAPPENGEDGSTASTPTRCPCPRSARTSIDVVVDLPTPGDAGQPDHPGPAGVRGERRRRPRAAPATPSSTSEISRATDRASPSRAARHAASSTSAARRVEVTARKVAQTLQQQRVALAAAAAQRRRAETAAAPAQLERQVQRDPGAAHPDRVAERDRAAVDVDHLRADAEVAHRLDADRGERLVDLDQVEVGHVQPGLAERLADRVGRLGLQRVVRTGDLAVRADLGQHRWPRAARPRPATSPPPRTRRRRSATSCRR